MSDIGFLLRRNLELERKVKIAIEGYINILKAMHEAFKHEGPFDKCPRGACPSGREWVALMETNVVQ